MTIPYRVHDSEYSNDIWKNHILTVLITLLKKKYLLLYNKRVIAWILVNIVPRSVSYSGADPGFQVRGGAHLKKLRRAEGGAKILGVFRVIKITILRQKIILFPIAEGGAKIFWGISCEKSESAPDIALARLRNMICCSGQYSCNNPIISYLIFFIWD